jgi:N-ethylmaleimide reductase
MTAEPFRVLLLPLTLGALRLRHRLFMVGAPADPVRCARQADSHGTAEGRLRVCALADGALAGQGHPLTTGIACASEVNGWLETTRSIHAAGGIAVARIGASAGAVGLPLNEDQIDAVELAATLGTWPDRIGRTSADSGFLRDAVQALLNTWPPGRVGLTLSLPTTAAELARAQAAVRAVGTEALAYVHLQATGSGHATCCQPFAAGVRLAHRGGLIVSGHWTDRLAATAIASGRIDAAGCLGAAAAPPPPVQGPAGNSIWART